MSRYPDKRSVQADRPPNPSPQRKLRSPASRATTWPQRDPSFRWGDGRGVGASQTQREKKRAPGLLSNSATAQLKFRAPCAKARGVTDRPLSFQGMILKLHEYWSQHGCLILQAYDMEMGAGTFHTATTLRALGPKPWNAAFVQPCRRPTDGRYGENPNRLQHYYQYQVILKPSPSNLQELYLGSLAAIGIDPLVHDIRFVEDDWESPTLGAWGLGWEVWCDGMEVTQFTYFQQMGGFDMKPVAGELTYGLERLAMYVQNVDNVYDLAFNDAGVSYGEVFHENEVEMSTWNFEVADTDSLFDQFRKHVAECENSLAAKLPIPAYEQAIKASHVFNLLQARGVISVAERQAYMGRVRDLAKGSCQAWMDKNADGWKAEFPAWSVA